MYFNKMDKNYKSDKNQVLVRHETLKTHYKVIMKIILDDLELIKLFSVRYFWLRSVDPQKVPRDI